MSDHLLVLLTLHLVMFAFIALGMLGVMFYLLWRKYKASDSYVDYLHEYINDLDNLTWDVISDLKNRIIELESVSTLKSALITDPIVEKSAEFLTDHKESKGNFDNLQPQANEFDLKGMREEIENDPDFQAHKLAVREGKIIVPVVDTLNKHMTGKMDVDLNNHDSDLSTVNKVVEELKNKN